MCLIINKDFHGEKRKAAVAQKDITVYKLLRVTSPPRPSIYNPYVNLVATPWLKDDGYIYETPFQNVRISFGDSGTYMLKADAFPRESADRDEITYGIHAYQSLAAVPKVSRIHLAEGQKIQAFRATIPAGTPFYLGTEKDIVAETMILTNIVDFSEDGKYLIRDWLLEQNELHNQLKLSLESIDELAERLTKLRKEVASAEHRESQNKAIYDKGFEAGKKAAWQPTEVQVKAVEMAASRMFSEGSFETYHTLQTLALTLAGLCKK